MGQTSFGKYRLIAELGHGGMADVFLAVQAGPAGSRFRKLTVVKRLRQNLAEEPEFVAMLVDEARIAARLNHPNVVQTNEVGEVDSQYFIAMEYLDGQPLHRIQHRAAQRVKAGRDAVFTKEEQYVVLMDALAGLHHAHELLDFDGTPLEIVHRDMTPHNVFVTYEGQVKVVDFGIAKAAGRSSETRQGIVKGKVRYMAPEQAIGQRIDRRADLFAAGIILWEVATGRRMWRDMDDFQIVQALVSGTIPRSPREVEPTVPEAIDRICQKALAQRLEDRYTTAEEFRVDLEQFLAESGALMAARRRMPTSLNELFKDKRGEIRAVIEKQLADLDVQTSGEFNALAFPPDSHSTPLSITSDMSQPAVKVGPTTAVSTQPVTLPPQPRTKKAIFAVIAAGAASAALIAGLAIAWKGTTRTATAATQSEDVTLALAVNGGAPNARVSIDDGPAEPLPLERKVPRDTRDHRLHFEAEGYQGRTDTVSFAHDVKMAVDLPKVVAQQVPSAVPDHPKPKATTAQAPAFTWRPPPAATTQVKKEDPPPTPPPTASTAAAPMSTSDKRNNNKLGIDKTDPWGNGGGGKPQ